MTVWRHQSVSADEASERGGTYGDRQGHQPILTPNRRRNHRSSMTQAVAVSELHQFISTSHTSLAWPKDGA